jgi:hypothetical protein
MLQQSTVMALGLALSMVKCNLQAADGLQKQASYVSKVSRPLMSGTVRPLASPFPWSNATCKGGWVTENQTYQIARHTWSTGSPSQQRASSRRTGCCCLMANCIAASIHAEHSCPASLSPSLVRVDCKRRHLVYVGELFTINMSCTPQ